MVTAAYICIPHMNHFARAPVLTLKSAQLSRSHRCRTTANEGGRGGGGVTRAATGATWFDSSAAAVGGGGAVKRSVV